MELTSRAEQLMGTTVSLTLASPQAEQILEEAFELLRELEQRFSANSDQSELMVLNRAAGREPVQLHPDLLGLIQLGKAHSLVADSQLNIAIGPLVNCWRIGFEDARRPQPDQIQAALALTDPGLIEIDSQHSSAFLAKEGMKIDLGALAKGYSADRVAQLFKERGVSSALINLGGNVLALGKRTDRPWTVGLQDPLQDRGHYLCALELTNQSLVTSGIYERYLELDGRRYHHLLDRQTGYPIESPLASISILSDRSLDGEIWTSRLFGLSPRRILDQINALDGLEVILTDTQGRLACSQGIQSLVKF